MHRSSRKQPPQAAAASSRGQVRESLRFITGYTDQLCDTRHQPRMADVRQPGYVQWLGMLESRLQTHGTAGPFGLPGPQQRPLTAGVARVQPSAGMQPRRAAMRGDHGLAASALSRADRPASATASDWGSAPVSVVHSEAQTAQLEQQQRECERRAQRLKEELRVVARERDVALSQFNSRGEGNTQKAKETAMKYRTNIEHKKQSLAEQKALYTHITWQLDRSAAATVAWGSSETPRPDGHAGLSGGGQALIGLPKDQPAAAWRPVGKATVAEQRRNGGGHIGPGTGYAPPAQRLSKLETARQQAEEALVTTQRQRAAEIAESAAWLAHLDEEIYRASTQMHASYKGEYKVRLAHSGPGGFGMKMETDKSGVTRITAVDRSGAAAAAGVVVGSEVLAVAGCTLERGQGQSGLIPVTAVLGAGDVEFRLCRPKAAPKNQNFVDFAEYGSLASGKAMMTLQYCAGHLHARYEWMAVQLRDAVVESFSEVKVFLKPIDPHAPRNRARTGAFEVQMCFHSKHTRSLHKVLLFSKLQRGEFPDTPDLLHQLTELQINPPAGGTSSWDAFQPKTKVDFAFDPDSFAVHGTDPFNDPEDVRRLAACTVLLAPCCWLLAAGCWLLAACTNRKLL